MFQVDLLKSGFFKKNLFLQFQFPKLWLVTSSKSKCSTTMLSDGKIVNQFLYKSYLFLQKNWLNYFVATIGKTLRQQLLFIIFRSSHQRCLVKMLSLEVRKYHRTINRELSCEICEIFKNPYFEEYLRKTASILSL